MIKKHILKILVFFTNVSLAALGICFIKNQDDKKAEIKTLENTEIVPISQEVVDTQNEIASDREQKLRDLNTQAKETKRVDVGKTTTTTTTTKKPTSGSSSSTSSTKTKTS
jgi:hypothetical protein